MSEPRLDRRLGAEALGTAFLVMAIIGSGIMAERLSGDNHALALLGNTLSTGAILVVLILVLGPISGAHLNPAVSLALALRREMSLPVLGVYWAAQIAGALLGLGLAHAMFGLPIWQIGTIARTGPGQWLGEVVASSGLIFTILACRARDPSATPMALGLYIAAAYLVHFLDILRQPGRYLGPVLLQHFHRYDAGAYAGIRARSAFGSDARRWPCRLDGSCPARAEKSLAARRQDEERLSRHALFGGVGAPQMAEATGEGEDDQEQQHGSDHDGWEAAIVGLSAFFACCDATLHDGLQDFTDEAPDRLSGREENSSPAASFG